MLVICDIECDSLQPKRIWAVGIREVDTNEVHIFREPDKNPGPLVEYAKKVQRWIGHNFLDFDLLVLNRLVPGLSISTDRVIDTLVVSRLVNFSLPGGHSLENWGQILGRPKIKFDKFEDFLDHWDEGVAYLEQDLDTNLGVFLRLKKYIFSPKWAKAMRLEHDTQAMCSRLRRNGFSFDINKANTLLKKLEDELQEIEGQFQQDFPPRYKLVREITPVYTKTGKLHSKDFRWLDGHDPISLGYDAGNTFSLIEPVAFDPASKVQVIDRLWDAGWKPTVATEGFKDFKLQLKRTRTGVKNLKGEQKEKFERFQRYGWKIDDANLSSLPSTAPDSAKRLTRWLHLTGRRNQLRGWIELYNPRTGRIHGRFAGMGAWTHRMAHSAPNMANATAEHEYRELWVADKGKVLVGCDAEGIQLRILAHYINDPVFTEALISGDKKAGTDAHSLNARALGEVCLRWSDPKWVGERYVEDLKAEPRNRAKTFIYAFVLGASPGKVAEIFECSPGEAQEAVDKFISAYPGLAKLKQEIIPADARRGYFEGFDGRFVRQTSEHLMLAGYLQNGESIIMKTARMLWEEELKKKGVWYRHVNLVHDEFQTVANPGEEAIIVGQTQAAAIKKAGELLNVRCPMAGEFKIGLNWAQTH